MQLASESQVRSWLTEALSVSRETQIALDCYVALLRAANEHQNLIAASTVGDAIWTRHIADSAQLLLHATNDDGPWIDLGSGPGLPGLVVALCDAERHVTLVESRRLRCDFLRQCTQALRLDDRVTIVEADVAKVPTRQFAIISARAFAPLPRLLAQAARFATRDTLWLLPKGRSAQNDLSSAPSAWQRLFHVEPSLTDAHAAILIGRGVPMKATGKGP
jgi:16S rRNA (guanine527-N7)-methyltransferase